MTSKPARLANGVPYERAVSILLSPEKPELVSMAIDHMVLDCAPATIEAWGKHLEVMSDRFVGAREGHRQIARRLASGVKIRRQIHRPVQDV